VYREWLEEYQGVNIIETKYGFCTYRISGETVHVPDVYILPEHRGAKHSFELFDRAAELGRKAGCKHITGVVQMNNPTREGSMMLLLKYGAKILEAGPEQIYFYKEL